MAAKRYASLDDCIAPCCSSGFRSTNLFSFTSSGASFSGNANEEVVMLQIVLSSRSAIWADSIAPATTGNIAVAANSNVEMHMNKHVHSEVPMTLMPGTIYEAFKLDGDLQCMFFSCIIGMVFALLVISFISTLHQQSSSCDPERVTLLDSVAAMRNAALFFCFLNYSVPVVHSLDLSMRIGMDAAFSGFLIGIFMFSCALGSVFFWLLLQYCPTIWQRCAKPTLITSLLFTSIGLLLYSFGVLASYVESMRQIAANVLIFARVLGGFGLGSVVSCCQGLIARLWTPSDRPSQQVSGFLMGQLGIGFGPMLAALANQYSGHGDILALWASAVAVLVIMVWLTVKFPFPLPWNLEDQLQVQDCISADVVCARRWRIFGCNCMSAGRAYIVAALEVASAMVLEDSFQWRLGWIGVVIGISFTTSVPLKMVYDMFQSHLSIVTWIRLLAAATCFATLLLATASYAHNPWLFFLGDSIAFSNIYLADALGMAIMQQNLLPRGSWYADVNSATLYSSLCSNACGRFLGPWLARWLLQVGGMKAYIASQVMASALFLFAFEVCVAPGMKSVT